MRADARRYEMWESSIGARLGLAAAVAHCLEVSPERNSRASPASPSHPHTLTLTLIEVGPDRIARVSSELASRLRCGLKAIDGVVLRDAPPEFDAVGAASIGANRYDTARLGRTRLAWLLC